MIFTIIFYIIGILVLVFANLLPVWNIYPEAMTDAFSYFGASLMKLNFIFDIYTLCAALVLVLQFEALYMTTKILISIIHTIRGNKTIDV